MSEVGEPPSGFHERHATCPTCGILVRITRAEQERKRSFCAVCDTQLDISTQAFNEPSPFREEVALELFPAPPVPPTQLVTIRPGTGSAVMLRPAGRGVRLGVTFGDVPAVFLFAWYVLNKSLEYVIKVDPVLSLLVLLGAAFVYRTISLLARREMLDVEGDTLVVRQRHLGVRETRIPVQKIDGVHVETELDNASETGTSSVVKIVREERGTVTIGRGYGYDPHVAKWLECWIKSKLSGR